MSIDVSASNSTTGAGAIDSWHSVVTECEQIKNEHGADRAATAVEIGFSVVSAALDTVALIMDPFAKLIAAGLGWLIEHVSFLRKGLDELAGNPDAIKAMADELHQTGQKLRDAATDLDNQLAKITGPGTRRTGSTAPWRATGETSTPPDVRWTSSATWWRRPWRSWPRCGRCCAT
ncbi:MAG TPA: hypothetical protein VG756_27630 [Pseudonocardiaceae bacterium]|jgi:hypothetical protein|nr:hypothetical protein [Pseudonocardiaceae bacterium]